jgi:hypothetical protein
MTFERLQIVIAIIRVARAWGAVALRNPLTASAITLIPNRIVLVAVASGTMTCAPTLIATAMNVIAIALGEIAVALGGIAVAILPIAYCTC